LRHSGNKDRQAANKNIIPLDKKKDEERKKERKIERRKERKKERREEGKKGRRERVEETNKGFDVTRR
jgi:hypothetical protein